MSAEFDVESRRSSRPKRPLLPRIFVLISNQRLLARQWLRLLMISLVGLAMSSQRQSDATVTTWDHRQGGTALEDLDQPVQGMRGEPATMPSPSWSRIILRDIGERRAFVAS
ncbi:hypothetical protein, partial [Bradyrhizobium sp.]|uniref:hypothetical protein n=1 Tax=Bradyrhizobium sp. TaxID=376 RepID=UPI002914E472